MCIKLVIIKKLYYDARPTKYQEAIKNGYFKVKVNFSLCFIRYHVMKAYEGVDVKLHAFVYPTLAQD